MAETNLRIREILNLLIIVIILIMAKLNTKKRLEFLLKLRDLLAEYNASIEVVDAGYEYEGHLTIYVNEVQEVFEFDYNYDITVMEIDKAIKSIKKQ